MGKVLRRGRDGVARYVEPRSRSWIRSSTLDSPYFLVNSNESYNPGYTGKMLDIGVFCTRGRSYYGNLLKKLKRGDVIFLYQNGIGIVAKGTVRVEFCGRMNDPRLIAWEDDESEYSVGVGWEEIDPPVSYHKLKNIIGWGRVRGTIIHLPMEIGESI